MSITLMERGSAIYVDFRTDGLVRKGQVRRSESGSDGSLASTSSSATMQIRPTPMR